VKNLLIYKATNKINDKIYIGQTTHTFENKVKEYQTASQSNCKTNRIFIRALRKYGFSAFIFDVIDNTPKTLKELNKKEIFWISFYQSTSPNIGYNIDNGGGNKISSIYTREKISICKR